MMESSPPATATETPPVAEEARPITSTSVANSNNNNEDGNDAADRTQAERQRQEELLSELAPPITSSERFRDSLLRFLDTPCIQAIGIVVLLLVIIDGAFFFFLLVGWQAMCDTPSKMNCDPRNWWYNWSIQALNVLFTYMNIVAMPWRSTQFLHIAGWSCPHRSNDIGCNVYGIPNDPDIWCYIPLKRRLGITIILMNNCIMQYCNQVTRIIYSDFDSQNVFPGNLWTNIFFVASFACGGIGAGWMLFEMGRVRTRFPGSFGPGPVDSLKLMFNKQTKLPSETAADNTTDEQGNTNDEEEDEGVDDIRVFVKSITKSTRRGADILVANPDPTRSPSRRALVGGGTSRAGPRLFAM